MAPPLNAPDLGAAEDSLISAVAGGSVVRRAFGNDALWSPAGIGEQALAA
jgi:hypothetical protein